MRTRKDNEAAVGLVDVLQGSPRTHDAGSGPSAAVRIASLALGVLIHLKGK